MITPFIEIDGVDKAFTLPDGNRFIALKGINLTIREGEFVSLIGHSGCGKSTLLNIVAGLDRATVGGVVLEGRQVTTPGPERMVVFQNYSLLPWKTVYQNIALAVETVLSKLPKAEKRAIVEQHIDLVGLRHAHDKYPHELSGGMKQRVAIARALAIRPKLLLLDEPFGALDALTRGNLQARLMEIAQAENVTCLMVTHDVDEALLLSDRVVMLTNGPEAHIGQVLTVPIPRPRHRLEVVQHPEYAHLRNELLYFLNQQKRAARRKPASAPAVIRTGELETQTLTLGFVPSADSGPLVVAQAKGLFQKYGLTVNLSPEPTWEALIEGVSSGRLDAAQMLACMPLAMTLGIAGRPPQTVVTALVLSRNGSAITLDPRLREAGVQDTVGLSEIIGEWRDRTPTFGVAHATSMQNLILRYWLAAGGIDPDRQAGIVTLSDRELVNALVQKELTGFCAEEPWNTQAVQQQAGYVVATDLDIWQGHPEKVLGIREDWVNQHPQTHIALVKALIEACDYCDDPRQRREWLALLAQPEYGGLNTAALLPSLVGPFDRGDGQSPVTLLRFHQFHVGQSNCPVRIEALWILTQFARWGMTPFPRNWLEIMERVRRVDLYGEAARQLGLPDIEPASRTPFALFDGLTFNPDDPLGYLETLTLCREITTAEIPLSPLGVRAA